MVIESRPNTIDMETHAKLTPFTIETQRTSYTRWI